METPEDIIPKFAPMATTQAFLAAGNAIFNGSTNDNNNNTASGEAENEAERHVADAKFDRDIRILTLYIEVILGTIGGACVFLWLWHNRRRKSRVNALIFHLALSDFLVIVFACGTQLVWEYDREWAADSFSCRFLKFTQSFAMMASTNMVLVLSVDRHQAIRAPLREPFAIWKMTVVGWAIAGLLSTPQFAVFHANFVNDPLSPFFNKTICESVFREKGLGFRQAYLTFIGIVVFYIPFFVLIICYTRIFLKIAKKANESTSSRKQTLKPGKIHLQSTPSSSLPKAKIKTLKMALVIVFAFVVFGAPYHVIEMILSYGDHTVVPSGVYAVFGAMAVANSAANPYVFMLFNASASCVRGLVSSGCQCCFNKDADRRTYFESSGSSMRTDVYSTNSGSCHHDNPRAITAKYSAISSRIQLSSAGKPTSKQVQYAH